MNRGVPQASVIRLRILALLKRPPLFWASVLLLLFMAAQSLPAARLFSSHDHYLALHTVLELFSIVVSAAVFALAWNLRDRPLNSHLTLLGCGFLAVSLIDVAHTLSYPGMPAFITPSSPEKAINFWLMARLCAAAVLLAVALLPAFHWRPARIRTALILVVTTVAVVWWLGLARAHWLPSTFVEGEGLTPLKIGTEYILAALYALAAILLLRKGLHQRNDDWLWLAAAAWAQGLSELFFSRYSDTTDLFNLLGHVYKALAYLMVYRALFVASVQAPYLELEEERTRLRTLLETLPNPIWMKDLHGCYESCNSAFERMLNRERIDIIGKTDAELLPAPLAEAFTRLDQDAADRFDAVESEQWLTSGRDEPRLYQTTRIAVLNRAGEHTGVLGIAHDITDRKSAEQEIEQLAFYDPLTRLPNRRLMFDRLQQVLNNRVHQDRQHALVLIDVDDFKTLNDTQGHSAGDQLLVDIARRLTHNVRHGDTVARLGGDEFVVIIADLDSGEQGALQARHIANKLHKALREPYLLQRDSLNAQGRSHFCTSSLGMLLFTHATGTPEELLKRVDTAMHQAKQTGRDRVSFFDQVMEDRLAARATLEADLRQAIIAQQFLLHYQLQVDNQGCIVGAEVLLRWQHPQRGMVSPAEFIPLAEQTGMIVMIGHWVLETACRQLAQWAGDPALRHLTLAVNVSSRQFRLPTLVEEIKSILARTAAPAHLLKLELTESLLLEHAGESIARMNELRALGLMFSLDDFGTGYSSLTYLKRLPLYQLKIDQSFVHDVLSDANDAAIARTVIALGHTLGLQVIAEGVETGEQHAFLVNNGCDAYQGYLFSRPVPVAQFESLARLWREDRPATSAH